jgi:hypothetical protein
MTAFPPDTWDCRLLSDFSNYTVARPTSPGIKLTALVAVRYVA